MKVLFCYDYSGSTGSFSVYHEVSKRLASELSASSDIVTVLLWDTRAEVSTFEALKEINDKQRGRGGTEPRHIAEFVSKNKEYLEGHLILLTDGEVNTGDVDACDTILRDCSFAKVTCHIVNAHPNLSVTCPFTRNSPHTIICHRTSGHDVVEERSSVSARDLESLANISSIKCLADFEAICEPLERAVVAKTMGTTGDGGIRDALIAARKRIVASVSEEMSKNSASATVQLVESLEAGDFATALAAGKAIVSDYFDGSDDGKPAWDRKISRMISMCEGAIRTSFGAAAISTTLGRARTADAAEVADAPLTNTGAKFTCPITFDEENDVCLLVAGSGPRGIFANVEKHVIDDIMLCPLNALNYPAIVTSLVEHLDHPLSLRSLKVAEEMGSPIELSPMTRKNIRGGMTLGASKEHSDCTDWSLARLVTGGKVPGNLDLWFAVIWLLVKSDARLSYLQPVLPQLEQHLLWRMKHKKTYASLTGSAEMVTTSLPLGAAVWFTLAYPALAGETHGPHVTRFHLPHIDAMLEMNALQKYELSEECKLHLLRLKVSSHLLAWSKRSFAGMKATVRALYQNAVWSADFPVSADVQEKETVVPWIPLDGPASAAQVEKILAGLPKSYRQLGSIGDIAALAAMVSPSMAASDVQLNFGWSGPEEAAVPAVQWKYGYREGPRTCDPIIVSPETCRPLARPNGRPWLDAAKEAWGCDAKKDFISVHQKYASFVEKYGKYPQTVGDLLTFLYNRHIVHGTFQTLPQPIVQFIECTLAEFADIAKSITPEEFLKRFRASLMEEKRCRLDGTE